MGQGKAGIKCRISGRVLSDWRQGNKPDEGEKRNRTGEFALLRARRRVRTIGVSVVIPHKERVYQENRTRLLNTHDDT